MGILGENFKLNFQANFYNIFNRLNLQNVNYTQNLVNTNSQFNNRVITFDGTKSNAQFGTSPGAFPGRVIELQIRLSF
jgi:hypothetical protein